VLFALPAFWFPVIVSVEAHPSEVAVLPACAETKQFRIQQDLEADTLALLTKIKVVNHPRARFSDDQELRRIFRLKSEMHRENQLLESSAISFIAA
jgi:hypothetical protein